jgi:hypothetical protein
MATELDLTFATPQRNGKLCSLQTAVAAGNKPLMSAVKGQPRVPTAVAATDAGLGQDANGGNPERPRTCQETLPPANKRPLLALVGQPPTAAALDGLALDMDGQVPGPTLAAACGEGRPTDEPGLPAYHGADGAVDTSEG